MLGLASYVVKIFTGGLAESGQNWRRELSHTLKRQLIAIWPPARSQVPIIPPVLLGRCNTNSKSTCRGSNPNSDPVQREIALRAGRLLGQFAVFFDTNFPPELLLSLVEAGLRTILVTIHREQTAECAADMPLKTLSSSPRLKLLSA